MGQYQRLLLIVDQTLLQSAAMLRAAALAKVSGAALHLCAFVEPLPRIHVWEGEPDEAANQRYLQRYRQWLLDEARRLGSQGLEVTTEVVWTTHPLLDMHRASRGDRQTTRQYHGTRIVFGTRQHSGHQAVALAPIVMRGRRGHEPMLLASGQLPPLVRKSTRHPAVAKVPNPFWRIS